MSQLADARSETERLVPTPALEMLGVRVSFSRPRQEPLVIVEDFNLSVAAGRMHCLVGRSGSGKTSLLRVAVALLSPEHGEVRWAGERIVDLSADQLATARRRHMGYVDQGATVIEELRVVDNVLLPAVPAGIHSSIKARAWELLDLFGIAARGRALARSLSGGERQRLALARAMLLKPSIICVDEPTANLDRKSADDVVRALGEATRQGTAVLAASHDHALVRVTDDATHLD